MSPLSTDENTVAESRNRALLSKALKGSARSFYLSLSCFPSSIREEISFAFLLCKIADTIVDVDRFSEEGRARMLNLLEGIPGGRITPARFISEAEREVAEGRPDPIYAGLPPACRLYERFSQQDRQLIDALFKQVISGMRSDLDSGSIRTEAELERYCYQVAGSAGEFLTRLFYGHGLLDGNLEEMIRLGVQLGIGLQLTNIIRDRTGDLAFSRNYFPTVPAPADRIDLVRKAVEALEAGCDYVLRVPKRSWRVRLASLWPVLFAMKTLSLIAKASTEEASRHLKISRKEVYFILFVSIFVIFSNSLIRVYFNRTRNHIQSANRFYR